MLTRSIILYLKKALNSKVKLYGSVRVEDGVIMQLLNAFFVPLIAKSHELLKDEILDAVYACAASRGALFFDAFVPNLLQMNPDLTNDEKTRLYANFARDVDEPSFKANCLCFINNINYLIHRRT